VIAVEILTGTVGVSMSADSTKRPVSLVVKVQPAQYPWPPETAMVYDERRHLLVEARLTLEIASALRGRPRAFFRAELHRGELALHEEVAHGW
jgi:hypothetical protein